MSLVSVFMSGNVVDDVCAGFAAAWYHAMLLCRSNVVDDLGCFVVQLMFAENNMRGIWRTLELPTRCET